jgi:prepilin-type N-terminal cleavage/methylation domain-containing protein
MNRTKGFSLIELMVVTAGLAVVSLIGMQITKAQTRSIAKGNFDSDILQTTSEITAILADPVRCLATLGGRNALSTTSGINVINGNRFATDTSGLAPIGGYGNAHLQIDNYTLTSTTTELAVNYSTLKVSYINKNILKNGSTSTLIPRKIDLYVEVDASNNITKCMSLSSSSFMDLWSRGAGSKIYYVAGEVGIGTSTPTEMLDVNGSIKLTSTNSLKWGSTGVYVMGDGSNHLILGTNSSEKMRIDASGNIGINKASPISKLDVNGDIRSSGVLYATSMQYTSDEIFKKNITQIENSLDMITSLRGVYFNWKVNNSHDIGFIAQEVQNVIPELVKSAPDNKYLTVDYVKIVPILVEAIKEQQKIIVEMKDELNQIKNELKNKNR